MRSRSERVPRRPTAAGAVVVALLLSGCTAEEPAPQPSTSTPSPTPTATPTPTTLQRAEERVAAMSPSQRAGQVLMTAGTVAEVPGLAGLVRSGSVSGVMVRGRSAAGAAAVRAAVDPVRAAATGDLPLLVATDQEGGTVQVLTGPGFEPIPSAVAQGSQPTAALQDDAARWGRSLAAAGVNLDLGPVADVPCAATLHDNPPVADLRRQYGSDPSRAADAVAAVVRGLGTAGVDATVKHFPGLGCVRGNTDTSPDVADAVTTPSSDRLGVFTAGVAAGAGFAMVSSASYARIDAGVPALFSAPVIDLLRTSTGFDGVVMSDDVGGAAAVRRWSPGQRAVRFVRAGGDLLLDIVPGDVPALQRALVDEADSDPAFAERLAAAAAHVVAARLRIADRG